MAIDVAVVRVFVDDQGRYGNTLAVVIDGPRDPAERLCMAARFGYSETVFVDDPGSGVVDIYTPSTRLEFAGYPLIGVAWVLAAHGCPITELCPAVGRVPVFQEGNMVWIRADTSWLGGRRTRQYGSASEVDSLSSPPPGAGWIYTWAWSDEENGDVRARGFPGRADGIVEDEATGAAALALTAELRRDLCIRQGRGSQIVTRYRDDDTVELGGRCMADD